MIPNKPSIYVVVERTPEELVQGSPNIHTRQPFTYHSKTATASTKTVDAKPELSSVTTNEQYGLVKDQVKVVPGRFRHLSNSAFVVVPQDTSSASDANPISYLSGPVKADVSTTYADYGQGQDEVKVVPERFRHLSNSSFEVVTRDLTPSGGQPFTYQSETGTVHTKGVAAKGMMSSETTNALYGLGL